jgi:DnaJ-class molecular chaperone
VQKHDHCRKCKDRLIIDKDRDLEFTFPKDFKLGHKIILTEQGNGGWKVKPSDLVIITDVLLPDIDSLTDEEKKTLESLLTKKKDK